jgi:NAD(P)-dependent dehydrogenase (short-subunit alcohol dehydrogenase family)
MSERMKGLRALVTGASTGLGHAIALRFAREGAEVAIGGRDEERLQKTAEEIADIGRTAVIARGDLSVVEDARSVVEASAKGLGGLDVVVNNAGMDAENWQPVHEWDIDLFDRILAVNLRGPFLVSKFAIPHLLEAGGGSILHMSSVCGITVWADDVAYGVSKAGLNMLSDHIAVEYGDKGIRSNTLMPGIIPTELYDYVIASLEDGEQFERDLLARHPIGRFGTMEEVADASVMLCSREARFMTGANIPIDGAYSRV